LATPTLLFYYTTYLYYSLYFALIFILGDKKEAASTAGNKGEEKDGGKFGAIAF
jgi:hypothetical protein